MGLISKLIPTGLWVLSTIVHVNKKYQLYPLCESDVNVDVCPCALYSILGPKSIFRCPFYTVHPMLASQDHMMPGA